MAEVYTAPANKYLDGAGLVELWKSIAAADKQNANNIASEAVTARAAETANKNAIAEEVKRAGAAETTLQSKINNLTYDSDSAVVATDSYISKVTQTNGQIAVEKTALPVKDIKVAFPGGDTDSPSAVSVVHEGVATITYDAVMSDTSRNAVQNKVVKTYVDAADLALENKIKGVKVTVSGDAEDGALVAASTEDGRAISVASTQKLKSAVGKAESAVQKIETGTSNGTIKVDGTDVSVHFEEGNAATTTIEALNKTAQDKVDAAKATIDAYTVNGTAINVGGGVKLGADNINMTAAGTGKTIAEEIAAIKTDAGKVKIAKKSGVDAGLPTNVKEQYFLTSDGKTAVGDPINIYKDQTLKSVALEADNGAEGEDRKEGQFLHFTYILATGEEDQVYLDVSALLSQAEMRNGLERLDNGAVNVKIDAASEKDTNEEGAQSYLSVSEAGVKISGIGAEIDRKISSIKGSTVKLDSWTKGANEVVASGDTVNVAIGKLQAQIDDDSKVAAEGLADLQSKIATETSNRSTAITSAIQALDSTTVGIGSDAEASLADQQVLASVVMTDGKITGATRVKVVKHSSLSADDINKAIAAANATA